MGNLTRSGGEQSAKRRDPWYFERWAFERTTGNPVRKAVLSMLAMMADTNTGRCEAKQETLAQGVEAGERAVRGHLKALEDAGMIARRPQFRAHDRGRRGDEFLLLAPGVTEWPDGSPVQPAPSAGPPTPGTDRPEHPAQIAGAGTTALENDHASRHEQGARAGSPDDFVPDDFPADLRPHARRVMAVLRDVAEQRGARRVTARAVGLTVMARPHKPLVTAAYDCAAWIADHPEVACRDVVARYRKWLDREPDLQGVERLDALGVPASGPRARPAGVTPIRRPLSSGERLEERTARRMAEIERLQAEGQA